MPEEKLSPKSQATISITPWIPKVIINEISGSLVKLRMPSQVVQPEANERTIPVEASKASCQFEMAIFSIVWTTRAKNPRDQRNRN